MGGWQFAIMIERGMSPMDTIRSATSVAAEHMGLSEDVGAIVSGKTADLIAVRGNPLTHPETLRQVDVVIQSGGAIKMPDGLLD
jgi:imidazolonepropionase-like amidohydrolase